MTEINEGNQTILPDYRQDVDAEEFMTTRNQIFPTGVYKGFDVLQQGSDAVIQPGVLEIADKYGRQVTVRTSQTITVTPTDTTPWILCSWHFKEQEEWWAEFHAVNGPNSEDIVLAEASFNQNGDLIGLDESVRERPEYRRIDPDTGAEETIILIPEDNLP